MLKLHISEELFCYTKFMKKSLTIVGLLVLINCVSLLLFSNTPISEYDYSNCPPNANCIGEQTKTNWTGYLPPINRILIIILGITFLALGCIWAIRKYKTQH